MLNEYIFKIYTPHGSGTGFLISYSEQDEICGIATALHVIGHAVEWENPIKLNHYTSNIDITLQPEKRVIHTNPVSDSAFILCSTKDLKLKEISISLVPEDKSLKQGFQIGWCGFPALAPNELCFFAGHISCVLEKEGSYLVDGVAINGVSGGPAFVPFPKDDITLCGLVSAYIPNRATGEAMPGVCVVRSINPFQKLLKQIKSLDKAQEQIEEEIKTINKSKD